MKLAPEADRCREGFTQPLREQFALLSTCTETRFGCFTFAKSVESATTQKRLSGSQQKQKANEMEASITLVLNHGKEDVRELFSLRNRGKRAFLHEITHSSSQTNLGASETVNQCVFNN